MCDDGVIVVPPALEDLLTDPWLYTAPATTTYRVNLRKTSIGDFKQKVEKLLIEKYKTPPEVFILPEVPEVVCIGNLRGRLVCDQEEWWKDDVNDPPQPSQRKQVMVDTSCGAAVLRGAHIFAPGVLAMQSGTKLSEQVEIYADVESVCKRGLAVPFESDEKLFLGLGFVRMQRHLLFNADETPPQGIAIEMTSNRSGIPILENFSNGEALLQNLPSIVCVRSLDPQPGETILDMCAAPGNKTFHIVEMMNDNGRVVALDKSAGKIRTLSEKIQRFDVKSVKAYAFDSTKAFTATNAAAATAERSLAGPPYAAETFDRILLDAACSALGNRPIMGKISESQLKSSKSFPKLQRKLIANAVPILRENGVLVYSTCTVAIEENEAIVAWVLEKYPEMQLVPATPALGGPGLTVEGMLTADQAKMCQRFGPPSYNRCSSVDSIGFFIAKFIKRNK